MQQISNSIENSLNDEEYSIKKPFPKRKKVLKQKSNKKTKNTSQRKKIEKGLKPIHSPVELVDEKDKLKAKSDEDNSVTTLQSLSITNLAITSNSGHTSLLSRLIKKPEYIAVSKSNIIRGNYGHSTVILKRPILEGSYYLEVLIREDHKNVKHVKYPSAVRVGICPYQYNCLFPIGGGQSIAYKSIDGSFVRNGQVIAKAQAYKINDVIGILMKISPPHKLSNPSEINEGSSVQFYKNGKLIGELTDLKQIFYCFAISLYNYSQVQIIEGERRYEVYGESKHYFSSIHEKIPYRDLEQSKIFKI